MKKASSGCSGVWRNGLEKKGGKKDKKEKSKGTCVEEKKRGKKIKKMPCVEDKKRGGKKEKRRMKYYHKFFTINFKR